MNRLHALVTAATLTACATAGGEASRSPDAEPAPAVTEDGSDPGVAGDLDVTHVAALRVLREEEKVARDVYLSLFEAHGLQVHGNIARAEQSHIDAMGDLLDRLGLVDPIQTDARGVFTDPLLQEMHDTLLARGVTSADEALRVGADIEDVDIVDLIAAVDAIDDADVDATLTGLWCGSNNHLRAFTRQLDQRGVAWSPTHLTPEEVATIVADPEAACGG